jgi:hypothetical protein
MERFQAVGLATLYLVLAAALAAGAQMNHIAQASPAKVRFAVCDWQQDGGAQLVVENVDPNRNHWSKCGLASFGSGEISYPAHGGEPAGAAGTGSAWSRHGLLVSVDSAGPKESESGTVSVRVAFEEPVAGAGAERVVAIGRGATVVVRYRSPSTHKSVAVLMTRTSQEEASGNFATEYRTDYFTIYSSDRMFRPASGVGGQLTFHGAKVIFSPGGGERFVLWAKTVVYTTGTSELLATGAALFDGNGNKLAEGQHLKVWFDHGGMRFLTGGPD